MHLINTNLRRCTEPARVPTANKDPFAVCCGLDAKAGCEDQVIAECLRVSERFVISSGRPYTWLVDEVYRPTEKQIVSFSVPHGGLG